MIFVNIYGIIIIKVLGRITEKVSFPLKKVMVYTDGACKGNPGPGGFGAILRYRDTEKEISGGAAMTTNNRMELTAVIAALEALKESCEAEVVSDSRYIVDAVERGWLEAWIRRGWKKADRTDVLNTDLWKRLVAQLERHKVSFVWIKGHDGHPYNERCDRMAVCEAEKYKG